MYSTRPFIVTRTFAVVTGRARRLFRTDSGLHPRGEPADLGAVRVIESLVASSTIARIVSTCLSRYCVAELFGESVADGLAGVVTRTQNRDVRASNGHHLRNGVVGTVVAIEPNGGDPAVLVNFPGFGIHCIDSAWLHQEIRQRSPPTTKVPPGRSSPCLGRDS